MRITRPAIVLAATLSLTGAGRAAEFACVPDRCIDRLNEIARKTDEGLVAEKQGCEEQGGTSRCIYRSAAGPAINLISAGASPDVQVIVIADARGLSAAGGLYLGAIMEAFDASLDADARRQFYNKLLGEFATSFPGGGQVQMSSGGFMYVLYTTERLTVIAVSSAG